MEKNQMIAQMAEEESRHKTGNEYVSIDYSLHLRFRDKKKQMKTELWKTRSWKTELDNTLDRKTISVELTKSRKQTTGR